MKNCVWIIWKLIKEPIIISLIQHFEADLLWKVSFKILNSGLILKTFTHGYGLFTFFPVRQAHIFLLNLWGGGGGGGGHSTIKECIKLFKLYRDGDTA